MPIILEYLAHDDDDVTSEVLTCVDGILDKLRQVQIPHHPEIRKLYRLLVGALESAAQSP